MDLQRSGVPVQLSGFPCILGLSLWLSLQNVRMGIPHTPVLIPQKVKPTSRCGLELLLEDTGQLLQLLTLLGSLCFPEQPLRPSVRSL